MHVSHSKLGLAALCLLTAAAACASSDTKVPGAGGTGAGGTGAGGTGTGTGGTAGTGSGGAAADPDELSIDERVLLDEHFAPLPAQLPPNLTNRWADNAAAATLGQKLFFLTGYSSTVKAEGPSGTIGQVPTTLSCASCHEPESWFIDPRSPLGTSHGVSWSPRNSPSLVNAGNYRFYSWAGKQDSMWMQGANSMEGGNFGGNRLQYVHLVYAKFQVEYDALFAVPLDPALAAGAAGAPRFPASGRPKAAATDVDGAWELMTAPDREIVNVIVSNTGKALEAYQRKLVSRNSSFERYLKGDRSALNGQQKRGLKLFIGSAGCASCHSGPALTNDAFSNVAVPQMAEHAPALDVGRYDDAASLLTNAFNGAGRYSDNVAAGMEKLSRVVSKQESDRGAFRVKLLWNVEKTGPYFHNGSMATLEEVVHHYNTGGPLTGFSGVKDAKMKALGLTTTQEAELVAFLKALTGEPVAAALRANPLLP